MKTLERIANELHQPVRKTFPRRKVISLFKDDLWQADLIDMQSQSKNNNGYKYILIVIDTYTKYVWVEALKNKKAEEITKAMLNILKKNYPKLLQTDNGTEFYNKQFQDLLKKYNIRHYSTFSSIKAGIVERVIRTVKNKIYKHFTSTGSWNWYSSLSKLIHQYNNSKHTTIKTTPFKARSNSFKYVQQLKKTHLKKPKFKINDKVRVSKYKHVFSKGYKPNWTTEIFTVSKVFPSDPVTYYIKDEQNNTILGRFYDQELKKTNFPKTFLIERVIRRNGNKIFVKWLGFDSNHNSWILSKDIKK